MNVRINQLVKSLLQKDSIEQCSIEELQQYAERHPYFGAAQLLLAKKMKVENDEQYSNQLQKTYLFFHNPLWVEALLNETGNAIIKYPEKEIVVEKETLIGNPEEDNETNLESISPLNSDTINSFEKGREEFILIPSNAPEQLIEDEKEIKSEHFSEIIEPAGSNEIRSDEKEQDEFIPVSATVQEHIIEEVKEINENPVLETAEPLNRTIAANNEEYKTGDVYDELAQTSETIEDIESSSKIINQNPEADEQPIAIPGLKIEAIDPATAEFNFGPYYAIDYFASQGIKFKEEEKPKDKFGQNLKSFTDWLKVMKRLPVSEIVKNTSAIAEKKVEQMAEHSLETKEVTTEAMAEVWEKQGNKAKAIDIYTKLSLLEPAKSTYFAAKIEDLKKTN